MTDDEALEVIRKTFNDWHPRFTPEFWEALTIARDALVYSRMWREEADVRECMYYKQKALITRYEKALEVAAKGLGNTIENAEEYIYDNHEYINPCNFCIYKDKCMLDFDPNHTNCTKVLVSIWKKEAGIKDE